MSTTLLRQSTARSGPRNFTTISKVARPATIPSFARGKATLPDLPYDYGALEPSISGQIMELHHSKHHQTYVNSYNSFTEQLASATSSSDPAAQIALQPLINFHGGGHINHSLFWENLAPKSSGGGEPPSGKLGNAIDQAYGSLEKLKKVMNAKLAGIQGSGWAWLVKDTETGALQVRTYANQDPVVGQFKPVLGIDAWEHAYYLQYQNRKAEYFGAIWDVVNWKAAEKRFDPPDSLDSLLKNTLQDRPHTAAINISEPGYATTSTTMSSSASLHLARELFSDITYPTKISDFTRHLSAIHDAAYLLLLPQTCPVEVAFHQTETARISTGPSGDAVLQASTLFLLNTCRHDTVDDGEITRKQHEDIYEATGRMLWDLAAEEERYMSNMALLLAEMKGKWKGDLIETGSWHHTALRMGKSGIASAQALTDLVGNRATAPRHGKYLTAIAQYWRKWAGAEEARVYEEVWSYVAGRPLVQE
ncbi:MAG: hypothetical protein ALECFALPRED_005835 [Alectoria fallacina]|uniref:superoxide dismutase n=1 Tax=Alectoria fallacina TaxID=1903189 RepID=A0A8H3G1H7_9LECA|nr:MAG: hypothetical protein ALECFALPRED_005835 [Alectoria fallacina]